MVQEGGFQFGLAVARAGTKERGGGTKEGGWYKRAGYRKNWRGTQRPSYRRSFQESEEVPTFMSEQWNTAFTGIHAETLLLERPQWLQWRGWEAPHCRTEENQGGCGRGLGRRS